MAESQNLSSRIMRVIFSKDSHWAETKKKQTIKLQLKHWNIGHTGVSPADPPGDTLDSWSLWHDDMMTLTLRILLVVLAILYIAYLNTQTNSQDKSTSAKNVS